MNIQAKPLRTPSEQALMDAFGTVFTDLPGDGETIAARDRLMADFANKGLPTRRVENWHYTDLRTLLRTIPELAVSANAVVKEPIIQGALVLPLLQGNYVHPQATKGMSVSSYRDEMMEGRALEDFAPKAADDAIGLINSAFVRDGYVISVSADTEIKQIIELQSVQDGGHAHGRAVVEIGKAAKATFIERLTGSDENPGLSSAVTTLKLADNAQVTWIISQEKAVGDSHLGQFRAELGAGATLKLFIINTGGKLVRQEVIIAVAGEDAHFDLRGINLLAGESHTDITLELGHSVPNTTSQEIIRNVVLDRARGVFQGQIRVARAAQKTDAQMACNTLLLSDDGEFDAKPELEIFADDVICAHGATVIDLDPAQMFYLEARGIPEKSARTLLINGFVDELIDELEDEEMVDAFTARIESWLEAHL